jgi:heme/copper-type cytochrome/quinol oxidase subunit 1
MTTTESAPDTTARHEGVSPPTDRNDDAPALSGDLADWLTTGDHKRIGRLYALTAVVFALGVLVIGALLSLEKVDDSGAAILQVDSVAQIDSLYRFGGLFLVAVPLLLGLAIAVVPLQVGARSIAFPRAAALSFWAWLVGGGTMIGAYAANGGPAGGKGDMVDLFLAALVVVVVALVIGWVCVGTTVLALRTPGMYLDEVPAFSWAALVAAIANLVTLPVLVGGAVLAFVDHRYGGRGLAPNIGIGRWVNWSIEQPQIYVYAIALLGIAADIVPVFARRAQQLRGVLFIAVGLTLVASFAGVTRTRLFPDLRDGAQGVTSALFYAVTFLLPLLGTLAVLALGALSLRSGKPRLSGPLVLGVAALLMFLVAIVVGALGPIRGLGLLAESNSEGVDTIYVQSVVDYVVFAALLGGLAGLAYWGPKLWGRRLPDLPVIGLGLFGLIGVVLTAFPKVILGFLGQADVEVNDLQGGAGWLNAVCVGGYAVLFIVVVGFLALALRSWTGRGDEAGDDPWDGHTLEWLTSSPPPPANFAEAPAVTSATPALDRKWTGA